MPCPDRDAPQPGKPASFPLLTAGLTILSLVLAGYVGMRFRNWNFDDAFIVYRYVANLRAGNGWVFNPGEHWNASTSVLNPILILLTSFFVKSIPTSAHIVGLSALVLGTVSLSLALLRHGLVLPAFALPLAALLLPPLLWTWGLETQLFLGLILVLLTLEEQRREAWLLAGLLVLVRPDGALFVVCKAVRHLQQGRGMPWRGLAAAGAVVTPWAAYSIARFGTLIPATLGNKRGQGASGQWGAGHVYLRGLRATFLPIFTRPEVVAVVIALAMVGVLAVVARRQWWLALLAVFAVLQQAAYAVLNPPYYHWYGVVFLFTVCLFALLGAEFVVHHLPRELRTATSIALAALIFVGVAQRWLPRTAMGLQPRDIAYIQVAQYVRSQHPDAHAISVTEAGLIGFSLPLQMRVVDLIGLTSDNPPYYKGTGLAVFFADPPDLALFHSSNPEQVWGFEMPVYRDPRFGQIYELERVFKNAGYVDLSLYRRRR